jgi:redox-sensing transcriptional repressor
VRERRLPEATVARLPRYLQVLVAAAEEGRPTVSSGDLAAAAGLTSAMVRKDLSFLGTYGTRGVGYPVTELATEISSVLGLTDDRPVVIVGIGNLGRALASYEGFARRGFEVVALIDADPAMVGQRVGALTVDHVDDLAAVVRRHGVTIAVLTLPAAHAQGVVDRLVDEGVTALLNFAPVHLEVPTDVTVRTVDLSTELQILSFYEHLADLPAATG